MQGFKKFHDCKESGISALANGRVPQTFAQCVAPVQTHSSIKVEESGDGLSTIGDIFIGQMRTETGIECSTGKSPFMRIVFSSNSVSDSYSCEDWWKRIADPSRGIHFFKNEAEAWGRFSK